MNYKTVGLTILALVIIGSTLILKRKKISSKEVITIGILQTASHPALDDARKGLVKMLESKLGNKVHFIIQNAQGSATNAHTIAQRFHINNGIKAIYAIATPAAQAIAAIEKEKPIIIAAVTDPDILGHQENISGVSDMINMHKEVSMIQQLLPNIKTIAVLYSSAEANSIAQIQLIKQEMKALNINVLEVSIAQESDISTALSMACRKADALLCPTDNMIASAMELVAAIALAHKKPLFACHNQAVLQGALAARGVDYEESGEQAGEITYMILAQGKKPSAIPIAQPKTDTIYFNQETLQELGLTIPDTLKTDSILV